MNQSLTINQELKRVFPVIIIILFFFCGLNAQVYPKMKINLKSGKIIEGNRGIIENGKVIMQVNGVKSSYSLTDVDEILSKKGLAQKWASGCCGGCTAAGLTFGFMPQVDNTEKPGVGTIIAGSAVLGIMGAGG